MPFDLLVGRNESGELAGRQGRSSNTGDGKRGCSVIRDGQPASEGPQPADKGRRFNRHAARKIQGRFKARARSICVPCGADWLDGRIRPGGTPMRHRNGVALVHLVLLCGLLAAPAGCGKSPTSPTSRPPQTSVTNAVEPGPPFKLGGSVFTATGQSLPGATV